MPKRGKKKCGDERDDFVGRPADLTFAAFLPPSGDSAVNEGEIQTSSKTVVKSGKDAENFTNEEIDDVKSDVSGREFAVSRTKKGKVPITYENRSKGKKVTVISNISGNSEALLSELRKRLGVGGVSRHTFIELQGDQREFVEKFFDKHPCLK